MIADERGALELLYKGNFDLIRKYVLLNSGDDEDAKDVYQDTLMIFMKKINVPGFELTSKVSTLLYGIARNVWMKKLERDRVTEKHVKGYSIEASISVMDEEVDDQDRISRVLSALEALGEPCRTILRDFFYGGLSMVDIAEKMGYTNADNAKNQKYKCMNRLKRSVTI